MNCIHKNRAIKTLRAKIVVCQDCGIHFGKADKFDKKNLVKFVEIPKPPHTKPEPKPFDSERLARWTMYFGEHDGKLLKDIPVEYLINILAYNDPRSNISRAVKAFLQTGAK
jgi:uncharacterized protein (DUF3820 family)